MAFDFVKHRQDALDAYRARRSEYEQFAEVVRSVLRASIPAACPIHSIEARAKGIDQFADKSCKKQGITAEPKYPDPMKQITDMAAARVITFFPRNIADVSRCVEAEFVIRERRDKGEELLAENRFGYQSIHYLVELLPTRTALPEYRKFDGFVAEVQVRTILQHAWAEMEHDIQYKSAVTMPASIRRRFGALAGMIEIADREFQAIQDADAEIRKEVREALVEELPAAVELKVEATSPEQRLESLSSEDTPGRGEYVRGSARALLMSGYYAEAVAAYDELIQQHPGTHTNYLGRARARFLSGNGVGALEDLATAREMFPEDPHITRLRAQIEEGTSRTPQERERARNEAFEGNRAVCAGDPQSALVHYQKAEEAGWGLIYSQFNKAIASCLSKDFAAVRDHLSKVRVQRFTPFGIIHAALESIIAIAGEHGDSADLEELRVRIEAVPEFSFARSHLRFLEEGLEKTDPELSRRVAVVFQTLQRKHVGA